MIICIGGRCTGKMLAILNYYKFDLEMKKVRDLLQSMSDNMQPFLDQMKEQLNALYGSVSESMKEIDKKLPRDPKLSVPPVKVMRPAQVNRKVIPVIYHHIRSNC